MPCVKRKITYILLLKGIYFMWVTNTKSFKQKFIESFKTSFWFWKLRMEMVLVWSRRYLAAAMQAGHFHFPMLNIRHGGKMSQCGSPLLCITEIPSITWLDFALNAIHLTSCEVVTSWYILVVTYITLVQ